MKLVALISGGKDSCFNALHCAANGHEIVALANLHPRQEDGDELDSHMYQTVGHDVIHHYAALFINPAAGPDDDPLAAPPLPLFRRAISGGSNVIGITYDDRKHLGELDEVEDLYVLLREVKETMPEVQGVSVGAILSTYQRVRVENVCQRLGLTVFAYLWEGNQVQLLDSVVKAQMNSVLIKVAGMGLNGRHLGKSLAQLQSHLLQMHAKFGLHPCGEGGEYETLTLDCPLFRRRLVLNRLSHIEHSADDMAPVIYLKFEDVAVEDKPLDEILSYEQIRARFADTLLDPLPSIDLPVAAPSTASEVARSGLVATEPLAAPRIKTAGGLVAISGIRPIGLSADAPLEDAARNVMDQVQSELATLGLTLAEDAAMVTVLVRNMGDFARVNAVYGSYFGVNPGARACVEAHLQCQVQVDVLARAARATPRTNLHVQSISYWASANIGPYSQAVIADNHVSVAGQIGLVPRTMTWPGLASPDAEFAAQAFLARRHYERICTAVGVNVSCDVVSCVAYVSDPKWIPAARAMWSNSAPFVRAAAVDSESNSDDESDAEDESEDPIARRRAAASRVSPVSGDLAIVAVPCLPRSAAVEWVASAFYPEWRNQYAVAHNRVGEPLDSDDEDDARVLEQYTLSLRGSSSEQREGVFAVSATASRKGTLATVQAPVTVHAAAALGEALENLKRELDIVIADVRATWKHVLSARVFYAVGAAGLEPSTVEKAFESLLTDVALSFVPVTAIENGATLLVTLHANLA
ncbi:hypothetical protein H9P43_001599 [Blastocladiella emersonii ATCC 22665]|nr:hypothetical protein H9P43_001599 [Blastocladiella emersonii ATCC 22665]